MLLKKNAIKLMMPTPKNDKYITNLYIRRGESAK